MSDPAATFVHDLVDKFEDLRPLLEEHTAYYEELLPHVFFGDLTRYVVSLFASDDPQLRAEMNAIVAYLDGAYSTRAYEVKNLIGVSFVENLPILDEPHADIREALPPNLKPDDLG